MLTVWTKVESHLGLADEDGATLVEYALLVLLIAIVAIVAISFAGEQVSKAFSGIGDELGP